MSDNMGKRWQGTGRVWWTDWTDRGPAQRAMTRMYRDLLDNVRMQVAAPPMRVMDPSLKKILETLPPGDPDAQPAEPEKSPPERVEVWTAWTEGRREVPCGVQLTVNLGSWQGPRMLCTDVVFFQRNVKTGVEKSFRGTISPDQPPYVERGNNISITMTFKP